MHASVARLLTVSALVCCCGTHPKGAPDTTPAPRHDVQQRTVSALQVEIERTLEQIAALRGWSPQLLVNAQVATESMLASSMLADARAQMTRSVQQAQSQFLAGFGWVPLGFDVERDLIGRFARDVTGLYCMTSGQILLSEHMDSRLARKTLRHELVHAFQDARYRLAKHTRWQPDRGDYIAAIHSLAEGEATCIALALDDPRHLGCLDPVAAQSIEQQASEGLHALPPVIRSSLILPYAEGVGYVRRLLREGGWAAIERAWNGGLQTTRQLLREDGQRVLPLPIAQPGGEFGKCELRYLDLIGEQGLRSLLWNVTTTRKLEDVLGSLIGERVAVWECEGTCVAAMRLRFAQTANARAFGQWLAQSAGMDPKQGATNCVSFAQRAASYRERGQDIAIASVLPCHGQSEDKWADKCPIISRLADLMAEP